MCDGRLSAPAAPGTWDEDGEEGAAATRTATVPTVGANEAGAGVRHETALMSIERRLPRGEWTPTDPDAGVAPAAHGGGHVTAKGGERQPDGERAGAAAHRTPTAQSDPGGPGSGHDSTSHAETAPDSAGTDARERSATVADREADRAERTDGMRKDGELTGVAPQRTPTAQHSSRAPSNADDGTTPTGAATGGTKTDECEHGAMADAGDADAHARRASAHTCEEHQEECAAAAAAAGRGGARGGGHDGHARTTGRRESAATETSAGAAPAAAQQTPGSGTTARARA